MSGSPSLSPAAALPPLHPTASTSTHPSPPLPIASTSARPISLTPPTQPSSTPQASASTSQPVSRQTSRLETAFSLARVRSVEAHPPHHAHFDVPDGRDEAAADDRQEDDSEDVVSMIEGKSHGNQASDSGTQARKPEPILDIEHMPCDDDPRKWSKLKKGFVLAGMTAAVFGPLIAPSIYNPVINDIKNQLHATNTQIGLSLSMYILLQGVVPIIWASIAEIIGRKFVYLASYGLYTIGSIVCSRAETMPVLIGMRCLAAFGSSAVVAVGAGSLADMYETHERGRKLGIFYGMPLLGQALGPLIGGALGNSFGWRSVFYFLSAFAGVMEIYFVFMPDTWRRERSRVYQKAMKDAIKRAMAHDEAKEKKRQRKLALGLDSKTATPAYTPSAPATRRGSSHTLPPPSPSNVAPPAGREIVVDQEKAEVKILKRQWFGLRPVKVETEHAAIHPTIRDVNPLPTMFSIFQSPTNAVILLSSGLIFGAFYTITYTAAVTLAAAPYSYSPLIIGLIILSFGVGSMSGSLLGGRYSDFMLRRMKARNGGRQVSEMRLKSTIPGMPFAIAAFIAYGWVAEKQASVGGIVVCLFVAGFSLMVIYSSTLAYIVDSNPGRSAAAVSCNSFMRGSIACVLSQVAIPILQGIGNGGMYTLMGGLLALSSAGILLVAWKGQQWRDPSFRWFRRHQPDVEEGANQLGSEKPVRASSEHTAGFPPQSDAQAVVLADQDDIPETKHDAVPDIGAQSGATRAT